MLEELRYFTLPKILLGLTLTLAIILGLAIGGYQPLANILHLRTTIPYYVTVTAVKTVTNTSTIVVNHTLTVTSQATVASIYTTTTTIVNTTTVRTIIIQPVTVTVNYTTTVVATSTVTITVPNATLALPVVNYTKAEYNVSYFLEAYGRYVGVLAQFLGVIGLKPEAQFACYATGFRLPNGSSGYIVVLVGNVSYYESYNTPLQLPYGEEYVGWLWLVLGVNTTNYRQAFEYERSGGLHYYAVGNVTVAGYVQGFGIANYIGHAWFPYNMPNGTYSVWLLSNTTIIFPCILEVVNAKSWSELANYTFLGAQYWAWFRSMIQFGKPEPCYMPWMWTIGSAVARLNITEPIGANWQYYCGPNGIWRNLKP